MAGMWLCLEKNGGFGVEVWGRTARSGVGGRGREVGGRGGDRDHDQEQNNGLIDAKKNVPKRLDIDLLFCHSIRPGTLVRELTA